MSPVTTRNITYLFLRFRNKHKHKKHRFGSNILEPSLGLADVVPLQGKERLLGNRLDEETPGIELGTSLPPVWVDTIEEVRDEINRIKEKISQLQRLQQKKILKVFNTDDCYQSDNEISNISDTVTALFKKCESSVKSILSIQECYDSAASQNDLIIRQNVQKNLANQLRILSTTFKKQQKRYIQDMRKKSKGEDAIDTLSTQSTDDPGVLDYFKGELETIELDTDSRNEELITIAQSVNDLHELFKDMSSIVIEQGTVLDRIDYNMEQAVHSTKQANNQLFKTNKALSSSRAGKCITFLLSLIFILLIVLVLKYGVL